MDFFFFEYKYSFGKLGIHILERKILDSNTSLIIQLNRLHDQATIASSNSKTFIIPVIQSGLIADTYRWLYSSTKNRNAFSIHCIRFIILRVSIPTKMVCHLNVLSFNFNNTFRYIVYRSDQFVSSVKLWKISSSERTHLLSSTSNFSANHAFIYHLRGLFFFSYCNVNPRGIKLSLYLFIYVVCNDLKRINLSTYNHSFWSSQLAV